MLGKKQRTIDGSQERHIRWMIRRDMAEVLDIERQSFPHPWTEEDFLRHLRQRNCIGMVCEMDDQVVGFMVYELHKSRLLLLSTAVHIDHRGRGHGRAMIEKLIGKLHSRRRTHIDLHVWERNLSAQTFFRHLGFLSVGMISYVDDHGNMNGDQAITMSYGLGPRPGEIDKLCEQLFC